MVSHPESFPPAPASFKESLGLLRSAQKPSRGTAAYSRFVNRPLGRLVAAAGHQVGLTPNTATALSAALSATGIILVAAATRTPWLGALVALLLALGYVMDSVDGQLARLRGGGSRSGEWLDHMVDCFKTSTLHLAVLISLYRDPMTEGQWFLLVPLAFSVVANAMYFGLILMPTLRPVEPVHPQTDEHPLRKWVLLPVDYGLVCLSFAVLGWPEVYRAVYTLLCIAAAAALAGALLKWWSELQVIDRSQLSR